MHTTPTSTSRVVARWSRRQARCRECGTIYVIGSCPGCGERADAAPVGMIGVLTERPDGPARLHLVEVLDGQQVTRSTRTLSAQQLHWLRRTATARVLDGDTGDQHRTKGACGG